MIPLQKRKHNLVVSAIEADDDVTTWSNVRIIPTLFIVFYKTDHNVRKA